MTGMNIPFQMKKSLVLTLIGIFLLFSQTYGQYNETYLLPKNHSGKKLISHKETLASIPDFFLMTAKDDQVNIFEVTQTTKGFKKHAKLPTSVLAASSNKVWGQVGEELQAFSLENGDLVETKKLPKDISKVSALEIGFGGTLFVADGANQKLYASNGNEWELLAEGNRLGKVSALLRIYGSLFIGTDQDLRVMNLSKGIITPLTQSLKNVTAITQDHMGYLIVLAQGDNELVRISQQGVQKVLPVQAKGISSVAFNPNNATLLMLNTLNKQVMTVDYLKMIGQSRTVWEKEKQRPMKSFAKDGFVVNGSEYLIHTITEKGEQEMVVPQGYYPVKGVIYQGDANPATASPQLLACAEKSYMAMKEWMKNPASAFQVTVDAGTPPLFWMMVDDYTAIPKDKLLKPMRPAQVWYWKRSKAVVGRVPGYWKWEAVLTQDGKCLIPQNDQIQQYMKEHAGKVKNEKDG